MIGALERSGMTMALAMCLLVACGRDDAPTNDANPWELAPWQIQDPTTQPDMTPVEPDMTVVDPPPPPPPVGDATGSACIDGAACQGGSCLRQGWEGGYCTQEGCTLSSCEDNGGGACVPHDNSSICAAKCGDGDGVCRDGYTCTNVAGEDVCLPSRPDGVVDGAECSGDAECSGGTCIGEDQGWPGGYCTTVGCSNFMDCASDGENNRCLLNPRGENLCVRICTSNEECRQDYVCQPLSRTQGYCAPDPAQPVAIDPATYPLDITCQDPGGSQASLAFNVPMGSTAYMFTPFAADGRSVFPTQIDRPDGSSINLQARDTQWQLVQAQLAGWNNPLVTPAIVEHGDRLAFGEHKTQVQTDSSNLCSYVLTESTPGTVIDMNVYFVGVQGLNAANAADSQNFQVLIEEFNAIYASAGVKIGQLRFYDVSGDAAQTFQIIRSQDAVEQLVQLSELPGPSYDQALSLNVFFTRGFALGGAIGISTGIPGPAALHGTRNSGVVFTAEFLGQQFREGSGQVVDGNKYTGIVFAHEVGHYLGLFHTTEQNLQSFDPISDSPRCQNVRSFEDCADWTNLMFPAAGITHTEVTPGQAHVIQVNPLTKDPAP